MADSSGFSSFVPGFDFLQSLVKNAGSALPSMGQWVVPTLDPAELERRIEDLRTVQFWLDQNSRMLATTIQALEVQRMTLAALKGMNVSVSELHQAMQMKPVETPAPDAAPDPAPQPAADPASESASTDEQPSASTAPGGVVDAMQWWGALTQQFSQIASQAMQDAAQVSAAAPHAKRPAAPRPSTAQPPRPKAAAKKAGNAPSKQAPRAPRAAKPKS